MKYLAYMGGYVDATGGRRSSTGGRSVEEQVRRCSSRVGLIHVPVLGRRAMAVGAESHIAKDSRSCPMAWRSCS